MSSNASRMVVITSNEELIAQFSSDPTLSTCVIDLDDSEQVQRLTKDRDDLFNLAFFAQLADQVDLLSPRRWLCSIENIFFLAFRIPTKIESIEKFFIAHRRTRDNRSRARALRNHRIRSVVFVPIEPLDSTTTSCHVRHAKLSFVAMLSRIWSGVSFSFVTRLHA